jgi:hypothetical protein
MGHLLDGLDQAAATACRVDDVAVARVAGSVELTVLAEAIEEIAHGRL